MTRFQPGKSEHTNFKYIGFNVNQTTTSTTINQIDYIKNTAISTLPILHHNVNGNQELSVSQLTLFRSFVRHFNWVVQGTRPDVAFNMIDLSTNMKNACEKDLVQVQKVI